MPVRALAPTHDFILRTSIPAPAWREFSDMDFIEGISQQIKCMMNYLILYGDPNAGPHEFTGFMTKMPDGDYA
jgi:hypothetical protein